MENLKQPEFYIDSVLARVKKEYMDKTYNCARLHGHNGFPGEACLEIWSTVEGN